MNFCQVVWNHQPAIGWVTSAAQSNLLCFTHLRWEAWAKEALLSLHLVSLGAGGIRGMEYMAKWLLENRSWLQMLIFVSKRAKPSELPRLLGEQSVCLRHKGFVSQGEDASMYPLNNQLSHPDINFYNFVADPCRWTWVLITTAQCHMICQYCLTSVLLATLWRHVSV